MTYDCIGKQDTKLAQAIKYQIDTILINDTRAWVKHKNGPDEVICIILDLESKDAELCYPLFTAYDEKPNYEGRILFDMQGFWIHDGDVLAVSGQEQVAKFIINYAEPI